MEGSLEGALLTCNTERRLAAWQNAQTSPTSQVWFLYDGEGHRVEQYTSGGSGNHIYYLPSGSLIKHYTAGGKALGLNTTTSASAFIFQSQRGYDADMASYRV